MERKPLIEVYSPKPAPEDRYAIRTFRPNPGGKPDATEPIPPKGADSAIFIPTAKDASDGV